MPPVGSSPICSQSVLHSLLSLFSLCLMLLLIAFSLLSHWSSLGSGEGRDLSGCRLHAKFSSKG